MSHFVQTLHMEVSAVGSRLIYPESSSSFLRREDVLFGLRWHLVCRSADEISDIEFYLFRRCAANISGLVRHLPDDVAWRCEGEDRYSIESIVFEELVDVQLAGLLGGAHGEQKLMVNV